MSRIFSLPGADETPRINQNDVLDFFERRARRVDELGPVRAVIYQDKHPDLAERRDRAEKRRIRPLLQLSGTERLLDVGCGTGRWVPAVVDAVVAYHGIDLAPGLVTYARDQYKHVKSCRFTAGSVTALTLSLLGETRPFDRILCAGVLVYLNDDDLACALDAFANVAAEDCLLVIREPVGLGRRLTIQHHYSDELEQNYSAIYRTEDELLSAIMERLGNREFRVEGSGDVYDEPSLNNRAETRQQWIMVRRSR